MADRYVLERELGAGGMASVFLAHDTRHNRKVAIKVMHPESDGERFLMTRLTAERPRPQITVVLNWFDELRARVPR